MEYSAKTLAILQNLIRIRYYLPEKDELDVVKDIVSLFGPYGVSVNIVRHGDNWSSLAVSLRGERNGAKRALTARIDTVSPLKPRLWSHAPLPRVLTERGFTAAAPQALRAESPRYARRRCPCLKKNARFPKRRRFILRPAETPTA